MQGAYMNAKKIITIMMLLGTFFFDVYVFCNTGSRHERKKTTSISSLKKYLPEFDNPLVIINLDSLIHFNNPKTSPDYVSNSLAAYNDPLKKKAVMISALMEHQLALQNSTPELREKSETINFINNNKENITIIGITSVSPLVGRKALLQQLEKSEVDLYWKEEELILLKNLKDIAGFSSGVLFCGANDKGKVLSSFLDRYLKEDFDGMIIFDHKKEHLKQLEDVARKRSLPSLWLRYDFSEHDSRSHKKSMYQKVLSCGNQVIDTLIEYVLLKPADLWFTGLPFEEQQRIVRKSSMDSRATQLFIRQHLPRGYHPRAFKRLLQEGYVPVDNYFLSTVEHQAV